MRTWCRPARAGAITGEVRRNAGGTAPNIHPKNTEKLTHSPQRENKTFPHSAYGLTRVLLFGFSRVSRETFFIASVYPFGIPHSYTSTMVSGSFIQSSIVAPLKAPSPRARRLKAPEPRAGHKTQKRLLFYVLFPFGAFRGAPQSSFIHSLGKLRAKRIRLSLILLNLTRKKKMFHVKHSLRLKQNLPEIRAKGFIFPFRFVRSLKPWGLAQIHRRSAGLPP